jgi:hypothetical protein
MTDNITENAPDTKSESSRMVDALERIADNLNGIDSNTQE